MKYPPYVGITALLCILQSISLVAFYVTNYNIMSFYAVVLLSAVTPVSFSYMIDSLDISIFIRVPSRIFKYYCGSCIVAAINIEKPFRNYSRIFIVMTIGAALDMFRAYIIESVKDSYKIQFRSDRFETVLRFEKYMLFELGKLKIKQLNCHDETLDTFMKRGKPENIDALDLFLRWSGQTKNPVIREEIDLELNDQELKNIFDMDQFDDSEEEISSETNIANALDHHREAILLSAPFDNKTDFVTKSGLQRLKTLYSIPDLSSVLNFRVKKKLSSRNFQTIIKPYRFRTIFDIEKHKLENKDQNYNGSITLETLERWFAEKYSFGRIEDETQSAKIHATTVFEIMSSGIFNNITFETFIWCIRQQNLDRENFYIAASNFKRLKVSLSLFTGFIVFIITISVMNFVLTLEIPYFRIPAPIFLFTFLAVVKDPFSSFVYIVFTHPFDSGDRIIIKGETHTIVETNIYNTVLWKWNGEMVYISNRWLANHVVKNIKRSKSQKWELFLILSSTTPIKKIRKLKKLLKRLAEKFPNHFSSITANVVSIENSNKIKLVIYVTHNGNFQVGLFKWHKHQFFMSFFVRFLQTLDIKYHPIDIPVKVNGVDVNDQMFKDVFTKN